MSTLSVTTVTSANGTTDLTITTGNTSGPVLIVGANGTLSFNNVGTISYGNSSSSISLGNTTVNTVVNATSITTGNSTVNVSIGAATVSLSNASTLVIGNSTVNTTITSNTLRIGNSSVGITFAANGNVGLGGNSTPTVELYVNGSAAGAVGTLTDGANVAVNLASFNNFTLTLNGARNLDNPTNLVVGQSGVIWVSQNSTGGQTLSYGSFWKFPANTAPTLTSTASAVDAIVYSVRSSTSITAQAILNVG
jgi:hypothetical protein